MRRKFCTLPTCRLALLTDSKFPPQSNRGIQIQRQEHQKTCAEFSISSKKHQFPNHQRRGWQQIPKIGEKLEFERNFNIASKTACRGFKSFCPCHRLKVRRCRKAGRLRAFFVPKSPEWTRSIDTGFPWQNPPNAPIFVNISTAAVWYIIKKASANFGKRTVLYRVPRIETGGEKKCIFFVQPCCVDYNR